MSDIGKALGDAMVAAIIAFGLFCAALTALCIYGIPFVWAYIKPWLHTVTQ